MSVRTRPRRLRERYGAGPWHLIAHLGLLAVAAFAIDRIAGSTGFAKLAALYLGLVIGHDLVLVPAYSILDRLARTALARLPRRGHSRSRPPLINHLRAPAFISALLLVIYAPLISGRADRGYFLASGHPATGYLRNWLLISAALFLGSALIYAGRLLRRGEEPGRSPVPPGAPDSSPDARVTQRW